ncbi:hypothetical protein L537_0533 [Bordetella hinzii 1277]|nr:hypothetical protein L537_0533 [Bordetella hinzii 1277]
MITTLEASDYELSFICSLFRSFAVGQPCPSGTRDLINNVVCLTRQAHSERRSNVFDKATAIAFVCRPFVLANVDDLLCIWFDLQQIK